MAAAWESHADTPASVWWTICHATCTSTWGQWFYRKRGTGRHRARYHVRAESAKNHTGPSVFTLLCHQYCACISINETHQLKDHYSRSALQEEVAFLHPASFGLPCGNGCLGDISKAPKACHISLEMARCSTGCDLVEACTANVVSFSSGSGWDTFWFPALNEEAGCQLFMTYLTLSSVHMADWWREWCPTELWNLSPCPWLGL